MMKNWKRACALLLALACLPITTLAEQARVINDGKNEFNRVKLRQQASTDASVLGRYYEGTVVDVLETKNAWTRVRIGEREGWMMNQYLAAPQTDGFLSEGVGGCVEFPQNSGALALYEKASNTSRELALIPNQGVVSVLGTVDYDWLHVRYDDPATGQRLTGYASIDAICWTENLAYACVDTRRPDKQLTLLESPSKSAKKAGTFYSGARLLRLFDHHTVNDTWQRVRVGDMLGYVKTSDLDFSSAGGQAFAPPLGESATGEAIEVYEGLDSVVPIDVLQPGEPFAVLAERGKRALVQGVKRELAACWVDQSAIRYPRISARRDGALTADTRVSETVVAPAGTAIRVYGSCDPATGERCDYVDPRLPQLECDLDVQGMTYSGVYVPQENADFAPGLRLPDSCLR